MNIQIGMSAFHNNTTLIYHSENHSLSSNFKGIVVHKFVDIEDVKKNQCIPSEQSMNHAVWYAGMRCAA